MTKRILITGGTSGIGLSAVRLFLEKGWKVMIVSSGQEKGDQLVSELYRKGFRQAYFCACNVAKTDEVERLYQYTMETLGGIDSIINNAGVWTGGMLHETSENEWERVFDVDVKSIFLTTKFFVPYMIENGGGTIVNTASVSGLHGDYGMAAYNAAKGAVVNLVKAMALDYGKYNIRVNNVCPSACATPMFQANPQEVVENFNEANPLKRICTPEEVAEAMYFLASDASRSCNGINLEISGGLNVHTGQPSQ